jgi:hypothetical protein
MRALSRRSLNVILQSNRYSGSHGRKLKMVCWLLDKNSDTGKKNSGKFRDGYNARKPYPKRFDDWLMQIEGQKIKPFG